MRPSLSPNRSAFSNVPRADDIGNRVPASTGASERLQRRRLDLPEVPVEPLGPDDVLRSSSRPTSSRPGACRTGCPVDRQRPSLTGHDELGVIAAKAGSRDDRDARGGNRPGVRAASHGLRPVGRGDAGLDRVGERRQRNIRLVLLHDERAVREREKVHDLPAQARRGSGSDRVPAARPWHAMNSGLASRLAVPPGRLAAEAGGGGPAEPNESSPASASCSCSGLRRRKRRTI